MLDAFQVALYQRLQAYELDDPTHEFGFTRHLMKSQGWTLAYTQRAIAEYKKFAFLTVVANHQVVPSDQVDQVWHAHVLLTQSYWDEFCPMVLRKTLHHHPARGGQAERAEFHQLYAQTIASYRQFFGSPPIDIWSPPDVRFGAELKMQRVSLSNYWVIPKRFLHLKFAPGLGIIAIMTCVTISWISAAQGSTLEQAASDVSAKHYVTAIGGFTILGLILRYLIRRPSQQSQKPQLDLYQIAYLVGQSSRAVELAIAQLVHQGYLHPNVPNRTFAIAKRLPSSASDLEKQVMQRVQSKPDFTSLRQANQYKTDFLREDLEQEKLLMTGRAALVGQSFPLFIVLTFIVGIPLMILISILGIQVSDLHLFTVLYQATGILTLCCFVPRGRTRWGSRILADIRKTYDAYDVMQRFALYGYTVLSGGALDDLKQIFKAEEEAAAGGCGCGC